jgi:branched-chain amino acid transport system ATP-binding protein
VCGSDVTGRRPTALARLGVARTFQAPGLFPRLDLETNLLVGRHLRQRAGVLAGMVGWGRSQREDREGRRSVRELVERLDLSDYLDGPVGAFPYGIQKRIELARALAGEPRLLLLDEPAAGTDPAERSAMAATLGEVRREGRLAVLLVEHDMGMVAAVADHVVALDFGQTVAAGTFDEVRRDPRVVHAYLGVG